MRSIFLFCLSILFGYWLNAQKITVKAGPEFLTSFNNAETFLGVGGSIEALKLVKERLTLGLNTGFLYFNQTGSSHGTNNKSHYSLIPVLLVIHYPLPITPNLYGEDHLGYSFTQNANYVNSGKKVNGGFTYYFVLGYTIGSHIDVSIKVGRSRLDKKNDPANVNEHNVGLKLAYLF